MDSTSPFIFCRRFTNGGYYLPGDKSTVFQRRTQPRESNVSIMQISLPDRAFDINDYWIIAVKALRNVYIEKELCTDYNSKYIFS